MGKLTSEEETLLKRLTAKAKAPDAPPSERRLNISIDLGDEAQIGRAQKLGLLDMFADDGEGEGEGKEGEGEGKEGEGEETPRRRGFFAGE